MQKLISIALFCGRRRPLGRESEHCSQLVNLLIYQTWRPRSWLSERLTPADAGAALGELRIYNTVSPGGWIENSIS